MRKITIFNPNYCDIIFDMRKLNQFVHNCAIFRSLKCHFLSIYSLFVSNLY